MGQGCLGQQLLPACKAVSSLFSGLEQLTIQADERSKVIAAVTAISMVKIPDQKKVKLNDRDSEKLWPETYTADRVDKKSFADFLGEGDVPECSGARLIGETTA